MSLKYVRVPVEELLVLLTQDNCRNKLHSYIKAYIDCALEYYWSYHMGRKPKPKSFRYKTPIEKKLWDKSIKILDKDCALRKKHKNNLQRKKSMLE